MQNPEKDYIEMEAKENPLWGGIREFALAERIIQRLIKGDINRLADVGCGDGYLINSILKRRRDIPQVYAIDHSNVRLGRIKKISQKIKILKADAASIPIENDFFDVVVCSEVLEHVVDYKKAIKALLRVTKKQLIITVPNDEKLIRTLCPNCRKYHYVAGHINTFDRQKLTDIISISAPDKNLGLKFEKFHTIYSYNSFTRKLPSPVRVLADKLIVSLEKPISFFKPNYLMAIIRKV